MLAVMSYGEFLDWVDYARIAPWVFRDERRDDIRYGRFMAQFANANRDPTKSQPFEAKQFTLFKHPEPAEAEGDDWKPGDGATMDPMLWAGLLAMARKTEREKQRKEAQANG